MSYTICSRFKGEHIVYAGYTICTSREHIVYGAFCGSTRPLSTWLLRNCIFLHSYKKVYTNLKRIFHDDSRRLRERSLDIHLYTRIEGANSLAQILRKLCYKQEQYSYYIWILWERESRIYCNWSLFKSKTNTWTQFYMKWASAWDFQQCGKCDQQSLRSGCACAQSYHSLC